MLLFACTSEPRLDPAAAQGVPDAVRSARVSPAPEAASPAAPPPPHAAQGAAASHGAARSTKLFDTTALPVSAVPTGLTIATHDDEIAALAVTDDGGVAVSADRQGGLRLWPSLDGAHEPVVVPADLIADQLAIARDGDDIVIAAASSLGQLVVIRTSTSGALLARAPVDVGRGIAALHESRSMAAPRSRSRCRCGPVTSMRAAGLP